MDALDVLKVCLRRWFVMLPVIAIAIGAGLGLASQQKPTYSAYGRYALVYQGQVTELRDPRKSNPLGVDGSTLLGEALIADLMSGPTQAELGGRGTSGVAPGEAVEDTAYKVRRPNYLETDYSETYVVETWGQDPESARATVDAVLKAAPERLEAIQERVGAPKQSYFTAFVTLPTQVVRLPGTSTLKLLIALSGVGVLAGAALSLLADRLIASARARRAALPPRVVAWDEPVAATPPAVAEAGASVPVPAAPADGSGSPVQPVPDATQQPVRTTGSSAIADETPVGVKRRVGPVADNGQGSSDPAAGAGELVDGGSALASHREQPAGVGWPNVGNFPEQRHQQPDRLHRNPDAASLIDDDVDPVDKLAHERFWEQETPMLYLNGADPHVNGQHVANGHLADLEPKPGSDSSGDVEADRAHTDELPDRQHSH